jgi:hypothetical protein
MACWLPEGGKAVRAMVIGLAGRPNADWQAFLARHSLGMAAELHSLPAIARATGHAEIESAPIITIGNSAGASRATQIGRDAADRCIAIIALHGAMFAKGNDGFNVNRQADTPGENIFTTDIAALRSIPMLLTFVDGDGFVSPVVQEGFVQYGRSKGAPWAFSIDNQGNHGDSEAAFRRLILPWLESILARRLPPEAGSRSGSFALKSLDEASGWLGDSRTKQIAPYASFRGDKTKANWFPDENVAKAWQACAIVPPYAIPEQPIRAPSWVITDLKVLDPRNNDTTSGVGWRINANFKGADNLYNDLKYFALPPIPRSIAGCDWIRPMMRGKVTQDCTADPLFSFRLAADADVFVAHDERIQPKPAWLSDWTNTGDDVKVCWGLFREPASLRLYRKHFVRDATVILGGNGKAPRTVMYLTFVKPTDEKTDFKPTPAQGQDEQGRYPSDKGESRQAPGMRGDRPEGRSGEPPLPLQIGTVRRDLEYVPSGHMGSRVMGSRDSVKEVFYDAR